MAYVYRHIRLDKNIPFYIGIGNDNSFIRANEKSRRNNIWNKIVSKSDYEVEIIFDNVDWDFACEKEKELIKLYGRIDLGNGSLSNLTDGGEGAKNRIYVTSEETKKKISLAHKGKKLSESTKLKLKEKFANRKFSQKHLDSLKIAAQKRDYKKHGLDARNKIIASMNVKPIEVYKDGVFYKEYLFRCDCIKDTGLSKTTIYNLIKNNSLCSKGYQIKVK